MTTYNIYAGGTFDPLHFGHIFYLRLVRQRAQEIIPGFNPGEDTIKFTLFVTGSSSYSGKTPESELDVRKKGIESHKLLENIVDEIVPLTKDIDSDLENIRYSLHDNIQGDFYYFFGDDQYDKDWAKQLRTSLRERYGQRVKFYWVQDKLEREYFSSSRIRKAAKPSDGKQRLFDRIEPFEEEEAYPILTEGFLQRLVKIMLIED